MKVKSLSHVQPFTTPWTAAYQAPPPMGFSRQGYWSRVPLPSPTMEYYSAIKKNTFESVLMRWMKLEPVIQSEVSQKERHQYSILTHIVEKAMAPHSSTLAWKIPWAEEPGRLQSMRVGHD